MCVVFVLRHVGGFIFAGGSGPQASARPYVRQHKNSKLTIDADLDEGERMQAYMKRRYGAEATADYVQHATGPPYGPSVPYGFYRSDIEEELEIKFSIAKRQALRRPFKEYAERKATGAVTRVALRGDRKFGSCRDGEGKNNSKKCPG